MLSNQNWLEKKGITTIKHIFPIETCNVWYFLGIFLSSYFKSGQWSLYSFYFASGIFWGRSYDLWCWAAVTSLVDNCIAASGVLGSQALCTRDTRLSGLSCDLWDITAGRWSDLVRLHVSMREPSSDLGWQTVSLTVEYVLRHCCQCEASWWTLGMAWGHFLAEGFGQHFGVSVWQEMIQSLGKQRFYGDSFCGVGDLAQW